MNTEFERLTLPIDGAFTISRGSRTDVETVVVRVGDDAGQTGIGAAAPDPHYGETADTVEAVLPDLLAVVESVDDPLALDRIERRLRETVRDNPAARAAVSIACHDLATRRLGVPLSRHFGLDIERAPPTSYTVAIDDPDAMATAAADAVDEGFRILKVKLGTDHDRDRVEAIRNAPPDATIRVDANEAWTPHEAVEKSRWLADLGVEFVEQPVPGGNLDGLREVHERGAIPVAADESCVDAGDVPGVAGTCDIVVGKIAKCGSPWALRRQLETATAHGLETMVGCMVESNASLAAAVHCSPLADYADLDGSLLLAEDPFVGVPFVDGRPNLADLDRPGTGVREQ